MKRLFSLSALLFCCAILSAQDKFTYADSINQYIGNYIQTHEVVQGKDKKLMRFYPPDEKFRITASFEKTNNSPWFKMDASGPIKKNYRVYGKAHFVINDTAVTLNIYQSQELMGVPQYKETLFIPFTDATSGIETYDGGRYFDLTTNDIQDNKLIIDFNKAYNPYCAYVTGEYNCPVPPKENHLSIAIKAGEMSFGKNH